MTALCARPARQLDPLVAFLFLFSFFLSSLPIYFLTAALPAYAIDTRHVTPRVQRREANGPSRWKFSTELFIPSVSPLFGLRRVQKSRPDDFSRSVRDAAKNLGSYERCTQPVVSVVEKKVGRTKKHGVK